MPSMDNTVARGSASVAARSACPTQSTPARVDNVNWNGAQVRSTSFMNCLANVFATNWRKEVPVAIPRTPPSFLDKAVIVAVMKG